jgi:tetratricopeptide (TPR) repeat protein
LAAPALVRAEDEIDRRMPNGKTQKVRGKITDESPKKVVIQTSSGDEEIPTPEVVNVRYDKQPAELVTIGSLIDQERYEDAATQLESLYTRVKGGTNEFLKAAVLYKLFYAQAMHAKRDNSKLDDAFKTAGDFAQTYPKSKSRFWYPFQELLGELHLAKGDFDQAQQAFAVLRDADLPGFKEKALVYEGLSYLQKGKVQDALLNFNEVLGAPGDTPEIQEQKFAAQVFKGEALLRDAKDPKKIADAEKLLREALKSAPSEARLVKATGYNALGDALLLSKRPAKEALLQGYLRVVVLYPDDAQQLARATYHCVLIFNEIGMKDRAEALAEKLRTGFPNSPWTKKLPAAGSGN